MSRLDVPASVILLLVRACSMRSTWLVLRLRIAFGSAGRTLKPEPVASVSGVTADVAVYRARLVE